MRSRSPLLDRFGRGLGLGALACIAAALLLLTLGGVAESNIAVGLLGIGAVLAAATIFYAIGRSEDRDRAAERRRGANG